MLLAAFNLELVRNPSGEGTALLPWISPANHRFERPATVAFKRSINLRYPVPEVGEVLTYVEHSNVTFEEEERLYKNVYRRLKDHDMPDYIFTEYYRLYQQKSRLRFFASQQAERDFKDKLRQNGVAKLAVSISYSIGVHEKEIYELQKQIQYLDCLDRTFGRSFYHEHEVSRRARKQVAKEEQQAQEAARRKAEAASKKAIEAAQKDAEAATKRAEAEAARKRAEAEAVCKAAEREAARKAAEAARKQAAEEAGRKKQQSEEEEARRKQQAAEEAARIQAETAPLVLAENLERKERARQWKLEQQERKQQQSVGLQQQHTKQQQLEQQQEVRLQLLRYAVLQEELASGAAGLEALQSLVKQRPAILTRVPAEPFKTAAALCTSAAAAAPQQQQVEVPSKQQQEEEVPPSNSRSKHHPLQQEQADQQQQQQKMRQSGLQGLSRSTLLKLRDCGEEVRQRLASGRVSARRLIARAVHVDMVERLDSTSFDQVVQRYWSP